MADFMGVSLDPSVIESIVSQTVFEKMQKADNVTPKFCRPEEKPHVRKGIIGDWKSLFSEEQSARLDAEYKKRLAGTGLHFDFE